MTLLKAITSDFGPLTSDRRSCHSCNGLDPPLQNVRKTAMRRIITIILMTDF